MPAASLELSLVADAPRRQSAPPTRPIGPAPVASMASAMPHRPRNASAGGPGWFHSSWELTCGLDVREGWPGERGLNDWIDGFLSVVEAGPPTSSTPEH